MSMTGHTDRDSSILDQVRTVTDAEVDFYLEHGWVKLEGLLSRSLASEMLERAKEVFGGDTPAVGSRGNSSPASRSMRDAGRYWRDYAFIGRDDRVEPFRSLAFSSVMGYNAQRLMGRDIPVRYWSDIIACKVPDSVGGGSVATDWHQDFPHYSQDRVGYVRFWIAMNCVPPERGSLRFLNGSHRAGVLGRTFRPLGTENVDLVEYYPDLGPQFPVSPQITLEPGDATCHGALTIHSALRNTTNEVRWGFMNAFIPADTRYTGASYTHTDGIGLVPNEPFDHPNFPVVYPQD